jgi:hypothetical protein
MRLRRRIVARSANSTIEMDLWDTVSSRTSAALPSQRESIVVADFVTFSK